MGTRSEGFTFTLNGSSVQVADASVHTSLLSYVRSLGLTGAKEGCAEGECGACAMLFVKSSVHGTTYRSVNSCLVPLPAAAGEEIYSVEGLAEAGQLAACQEAMAAGGGSQCGYCTPGFVVSMFAEHYRREERPADYHALGGNLCRCTGYRPIRDALLSLEIPPEGRMKQRLQADAPVLRAIEYAPHEGRFSRPCSLAECLSPMARDKNARFVAGNTDLGVMSNLRDERFAHLISLDGVAELREFRDGPDGVEIGAGLTLTEIGELWRDAPVVFHKWLELFASPLIRNRATLGGNLATASPIGDSAPLLLALDAQVRIVGIDGERILPLNEFFLGYRKTALERGEIIRSICLPKPWPEKVRFFKVAKRSMDDISTVAAGIAMQGKRLTMGFGGVAATPLHVTALGMEDAIEQVARFEPIRDHRGSTEYRRAMAASLIRKFFAEASA